MIFVCLEDLASFSNGSCSGVNFWQTLWGEQSTNYNDHLQSGSSRWITKQGDLICFSKCAAFSFFVWHVMPLRNVWVPKCRIAQGSTSFLQCFIKLAPKIPVGTLARSPGGPDSLQTMVSSVSQQIHTNGETNAWDLGCKISRKLRRTLSTNSWDPTLRG